MGLIVYLVLTGLHAHTLTSDTQQLGQDLTPELRRPGWQPPAPGLVDVVVKQVNTSDFEDLWEKEHKIAH